MHLIEPFKKVWQFLLVNLIVGIIFALIFVNDLDKYPGRIFPEIIWAMLISTTQWLGHAFIQTQIGKLYPWLKKPVQRIIWTLISVPAYCIVAYMTVDILMNFIVFGKVPAYAMELNSAKWIMPVTISFIIYLLAAAYGFFINLKNSIIEQEKLKREMLTYKYEALRNQINPHFMFNSLNVLSDLVYDDQKLAVRFIHEFSDIYRYVLDSREAELVPLKQELGFIEKFIFLLKIRFEDKLIIDVDIPAEDDDLIVPLSLQLLIENAVKHNEISTKNPLFIKIVRTGNSISVSNPVRLRKNRSDSKEIGLKNLAQQFSYFTDKEPIINHTDSIFEVILPVLKKEV